MDPDRKADPEILGAKRKASVSEAFLLFAELRGLLYFILPLESRVMPPGP
jgi:hypothetical protein